MIAQKILLPIGPSQIRIKLLEMHNRSGRQCVTGGIEFAAIRYASGHMKFLLSKKKKEKKVPFIQDAYRTECA